jgi:hypothetical protein
MSNELRAISETYTRLQKDWTARYGSKNDLLDRQGRYENVIKYTYCFDKINEHFENLDRVTILASSAPVALCYLLKKFYDSKITIVSDHPVLDRIGDFFREEYGTDIVDANPLFEDVSEYFMDADLVIFPEFEHFAPLNLIKYYDKKKNTLAIHYVDRVSPTSMSEEILSTLDIVEHCDFDECIEVGAFKNISDRNIFYGIGVK